MAQKEVVSIRLEPRLIAQVDQRGKRGDVIAQALELMLNGKEQTSLGVDGGGGADEDDRAPGTAPSPVTAPVSAEAEVIDARAPVPSATDIKRFAYQNGISEHRARRQLEGKS